MPNKVRLILYSLINISGKDKLTINLTGLLNDFDVHNTNTLEINLPTGLIRLNKWHWMNKGKVYDCETPFLVANKQLSAKYAEQLLIAHKKQKIAA